jgi:hypothetical protein
MMMGHRRFKLTAQCEALTMNSASALSIRSIVDSCNASTSQPFFRTWKLDLNFPPGRAPFDQFDGLLKRRRRPVCQQAPFDRLEAFGRAYFDAGTQVSVMRPVHPIFRPSESTVAGAPCAPFAGCVPPA